MQDISIQIIGSYFVVSQIILFMWYYLTLPKIQCSIKSDKKKASIKSSLFKFLVFMLPLYMYIGYIIYITPNILNEIKKLNNI